jgi:hypothetical protein
MPRTLPPLRRYEATEVTTGSGRAPAGSPSTTPSGASAWDGLNASNCDVSHSAAAASPMLITAVGHITDITGCGMVIAMIVGQPPPSVTNTKFAGQQRQ